MARVSHSALNVAKIHVPSTMESVAPNNMGSKILRSHVRMPRGSKMAWAAREVSIDRMTASCGGTIQTPPKIVGVAEPNPITPRSK